MNRNEDIYEITKVMIHEKHISFKLYSIDKIQKIYRSFK